MKTSLDTNPISTDSNRPITASGLGTFGGVFTPSILTILGVIMYLRFGWVVGNAGLIGTLVIVTISTSITFLTALSVCAIAMKIIIPRIFSSIIFSLTLCQSLAIAQSTPPDGVTIPSDTPSRVEETIPKPTETPLPSTPIPSDPPALEVPSPEPSKLPTTSGNDRINIKKVKVLGHTVLQDEIERLIKKYENCSEQVCSVSFEELVQLRSNITQLYLDNGYITSGAFIVTLPWGKPTRASKQH